MLECICRKEIQEKGIALLSHVMVQRFLPNAPSFLVRSPFPHPPLYASPRHRSSREQVQVPDLFFFFMIVSSCMRIHGEKGIGIGKRWGRGGCQQPLDTSTRTW